MAVFLAALDMTIVATALPTIAADFNISQADYTWIGSAYLLACAASTPAWGKVSDIFGRKPVLLIANVVFFVGSLLCGVSVNVDMLIAGRVIQGIGGGGLLSLVNICIGDLFSMRSRGAYYGIVGMTWALAGAIGPIIGGALAEYSTWRWCFYINRKLRSCHNAEVMLTQTVPCDGLAFVLLFFFLDIETPRTPVLAGFKAIDWVGLVFIVGGVVMFLLGLEFGGVSFAWNSATVLCLIIFGLVTVGIFFVVEAKVAKYPMMPLRLFKKRSALACFGTVFCHGFVFIAGSYFLPLYFQAVLSASPLLSGVYQLPFILSLSIFSAVVGIFIKKTGQFLPPIIFGTTLMTLGFGLFIDLPAHASWAKIIIYQIIAGIGTGPNFQSPLIALQSHTERADLATATATFAFVRQLGSALSIVIGGVIFQNRMSAHAGLLQSVLPDDTAALLSGGSAGASVGVVKGLQQPAKRIVQQVYTASLKDMWIFYTAFAFVGLGCSLLIQKAHLSKNHTVRKQGLEQQELDRVERVEREDLKREEKRMFKLGRDVEKGS